MDGETDTEESSEAESDEADSVDFDDWEDSDEAGSDYADNSEAGSDDEDIIEKVIKLAKLSWCVSWVNFGYTFQSWFCWFLETVNDCQFSAKR